MTIREIRTSEGLSQQAFGDKYQIPKRTIENWEQGSRKCPDYVINMIGRLSFMNTLGAITKLYKGINSEDILADIESNRLTEQTCRNGRTALWYINEGTEAAIYTDTLELLTEEEINEQLAD